MMSAWSVLVRSPEPAIEVPWLGRAHLGVRASPRGACRRGACESPPPRATRIAVDQHRNEPRRIQLEVFGRLVRALVAVDERKAIGNPELLEEHVGGEVGVGRVVVKDVHEPNLPLHPAHRHPLDEVPLEDEEDEIDGSVISMFPAMSIDQSGRIDRCACRRARG